MFITNLSSLNLSEENYYKCDNFEACNLIEQGFPLLSMKEEVFYFYKSKELKEFLVKVVRKLE